MKPNAARSPVENAAEIASLQRWIDGFNLIYVWALVIGVVAAAVVAGTSWKIIKWQGEIQAKKDEIQVQKDRDFGAYKLTVDGKVADAKTAGIAAGKIAGDATLKASEANERAAKIEQENIKLRLQLAERTAPLVERRLRPEQIKMLSDALRGSGLQVAIIAGSADIELNDFANDFRTALEGAAGADGSKVFAGMARVSGAIRSGVSMIPDGVNVQGPDSPEKALLEGALRKANISFGIASAPGTDGFMVGPLHIVIGPRANLSH